MILKRNLARAAAILTAAALALMCLSGCGQSKKSNKELNIIVWDGTWSEEMFQDFEKETGITVNISYVDNTDTLMSKLIQGNADYDLIDLEGAYVKPFVQHNLLAKIDQSKITNTKYIVDDYKKTGPIGDKNLEYTVPDMAPSYTSVIVNKKTCPIKITRFSDLANPKLKDQLAMVNATNSLYGAALQDLGYSAASTDESQIAEANALLKKIKKNVKAFVGESAVSQLESGECSVAFCWDYPTLCGDSDTNWDKFEEIPLKGGNEYCMQYWAVPKASTHKKEAQQLINFILRPKELAKCYKEYYAVPLEKKSAIAKYLPKNYYKNPSIKSSQRLLHNSWNVSVDEKQIALMDSYYTKLMGEK